MNKALLYGIGAVVVVAIVAGVALTMTGKQQTQQMGAVASPTPTTVAATQNAAAQSGSFKDLLAMTGAQTCTFTDAAGTNGSGTVYVTSGNVRADFTSSASNGKQQMHMIVKDQTSYVWGDAFAGKGIKMSMADMAKPAANGQEQTVDTNEAVQYSCAPGAVDAALFTLPANVQFSDLGALMQTQTQARVSGAPTPSAAQCAQCDSVPAAAKAQCLSALGCK